MFRSSMLLQSLAMAVVLSTTHVAHTALEDTSATVILEQSTSVPVVLESVRTPGEASGLDLQIPSLNGSKPWTSLAVDNDPKNFQFLIVTDRTGGLRPGIFDKAVEKINLLRPEFVISVGDLIMGYTHNKEVLKRQWDEFDGLVKRLTMPFFYVPGNHDVTNPLMTKVWKDRYGPTYYHFIYGNVLFLCLNSEDPESALSTEQIDYFKNVLSEHQSVRHTLVFLHRPLWLSSESGKSEGKLGGPYNARNWERFEKLLTDRPYTVFAGHVHQYTKFIREDRKYFTLGTTGGGSAMRGAPGFGEFDHVTWVTMTDEGPIMANLDINGIWDENVRTEEVTKIVHAFLRQGIRAETVVTDPLPFTTATIAIRLQNDSNVPATVELDAPEGLVRWTPEKADISVPPNSVEFTTFTLAGDQVGTQEGISGIRLDWKTTFPLPDKPAVIISDNIPIHIDARRIIEHTTATMQIDGQLTDWETPLGAVQRFIHMEGRPPAYQGPKDASFQVAARYTDSHVFFGFQIADEAIHPSPDAANPKDGDCLDIRFDLNEADENRQTVLLVTPNVKDTSGTVKVENGVPGLETAMSQIEGGYAVEVGIPVDAMLQKSDWTRVRLNVFMHDIDDDRDLGKTVHTWRPGWKTPENYAGSGEFIRGR